MTRTTTPMLANSPLLSQATVSGEFSPRADMTSLLESTATPIGGLYGGFIEGVWNSEDAGATQIKIEITGRGDSYAVVLLDNGRGMGDGGRTAFMNVAMSSRKGDSKARGRHGLGVKRMLSDFKYCEVVDVCNSDLNKTMAIWAFTTDDYLRRLSGDNSVRLPRNTIPRDPTKIGLAVNETGVRIRLVGARGRQQSPEAVRKNLPRYLPPWVSDKVTVNGEPLEKREIMGEMLELAVEEDPVLGRIDARIYIPKDATSADVLQIGAFEPLCTGQEFYLELPKRLQDEFPSVLRNPQVCGVIYVSGFKDFRSGSNKSFDPKLFETDMIDAFVNFLQFQLAPPIEEKLGYINDSSEGAQDQRLLSDLTKLCGVLGGGEHTPPEPKMLELSMKTIELLPGEKAEFRVRRHAESIAEVKWEDVASGGKVKLSNNGMNATFTAGKLTGVYRLVAYAAGQREVSATIEIAIVSERVLRVTPTRVTIEPREEVTLKALNVDEATSGARHLLWMSNEPGHRFSPGRGEEVKYRAGRSEGSFEITVYDSKSRSKGQKEDWLVKATCHVDVILGGKRPPISGPGTTPGDGDVSIDGTAYRIKLVHAGLHPSLSWVAATGRVNEINLNTGHPIYKKTKGGHWARMQLALREVLLRHIQICHAHESLTVEETQNLMCRLHSTIIERSSDATDE